MIFGHDFVNGVINEEEEFFWGQTRFVHNQNYHLTKTGNFRGTFQKFRIWYWGSHFLFSTCTNKILEDATTIQIKVHVLRINKWTLLEEVQVKSFNLGIDEEP